MNNSTAPLKVDVEVKIGANRYRKLILKAGGFIVGSWVDAGVVSGENVFINFGLSYTRSEHVIIGSFDTNISGLSARLKNTGNNNYNIQIYCSLNNAIYSNAYICVEYSK